MERNIKSYGYANAWIMTPQVIHNCHHERKSQNIGKCLTRYTCEKCGFTYVVDSSD